MSQQVHQKLISFFNTTRGYHGTLQYNVPKNKQENVYKMVPKINIESLKGTGT